MSPAACTSEDFVCQTRQSLTVADCCVICSLIAGCARQAVLDLRTAKRSCKQLEKHELTSQSRPSPDSSTVRPLFCCCTMLLHRFELTEACHVQKQRLRTRHRARHKADGHTCKSCKDCSLAYSRKYDTDVPVYHGALPRSHSWP